MSQYLKTLTVQEVRNDFRKIPTQLIYAEKPYVIINEHGVVLWAGDLFDFEHNVTIKSGYYDKCFLCVRTHDLYLNNNTKASLYPECEKLDKHSDYIKGVLEFMEFVNEKGIRLVSPKREVCSSEDLLYEMFGIDKEKLEKERNDMLAAFKG